MSTNPDDTQQVAMPVVRATSLDLDAITARWARVTPGKWHQYPDCSEEETGTHAHIDTDVEGVIVECYSESARDNVIAIAHAPTDVQALVAEVDRLRADVALMRAAGLAAAAVEDAPAGAGDDYAPAFEAMSAATDALWARCDALAIGGGK